MHWIDWTIVGVYAVSALLIGFYFTKKASEGIEDFFVAGRSLGWFVLGTSMVATTFSADTPLWVAGISRSEGIYENWLWWSAAMAGMAGVFFFAHLWRRSGVVTEIEFIALRYMPSKWNDALRIFKVGFEGIIMNCILMGGVTIAVSKIITAIVPESVAYSMSFPLIGDVSGTALLVIVLGLTAVFYCSLSGLYGVVYTDLIQFGLAMVGSIAMAIIIYNQGSEGGLLANLNKAEGFDEKLLRFFPSFEKFDLTAFTFVVYMTISWWGASSASGNMVQRLLSAKTENDAVKGFFWYNICHYIIRPWPWIIVGILSLIYLPNLDDPETAFPLMINEFMPIGLKGIMVASLFAAYMSTIDTHLNWGSSYVVNDFYKPFIKKKADPKHYVRVARIVMLMITLLAIIVASQIDSILQLYKYVLLVGGGIGTILIARWYWWRVNLQAELTAYILSFVLAPILTVYLTNGPDSDYFAIRLIIITTVVTIAWVVVAFITNPAPNSQAIAFHKKMKIGGIGWRKVGTLTGIKGEDSRIPRSILGWVLGCTMLYGFLIGTGKLLFHQSVGWWFISIGLASAFLLNKYVLKKILLK